MRHPVSLLEERLGGVGPVAVVVLAFAVLGEFLPDVSPEFLLVVIVVSALVAGYRRRTERAESSELEEARTAYAEGDISLREFEERVELILDDEAGRIREAVEEVNRVGPATSASIALEFDRLEDLEGASREDLERIHGVGPSTADAVLERVGGSR